MYSYRNITTTTDWEDFRQRIFTGEEDPSGLTPRVKIPPRLIDFCGVPQTDDVVVGHRTTGGLLRVHETTEKFGRTRTYKLRRFGATIRSSESDWLDEALTYVDLESPIGQDIVDSVISPSALKSLDEACQRWLGQGRLLFGVKDVRPNPDTPSDFVLVVTWSGFATRNGVPFRGEYYRQTDEFHRFIIKNPSHRHLLWTPHVERAAQFKFGDAGDSFVAQYHGVYTGELLDNWKPQDRIPLGFRALVDVHPGNIVAGDRNRILKEQDDAYDKMVESMGGGVLSSVIR